MAKIGYIRKVEKITLHLIRHAKSSWDNPVLADIERPLNQRGKRSCRVIAPKIVELGCDFQQVIASNAIRAQQTIEGIANSLPNIQLQWHTKTQLYTFNASALLAYLQSLELHSSNLVVIGHNPALTDLCNYLTGSDIDNIPTAGYAQLTSIGPISWQDLTRNSFALCHFIKPKDFKTN
ncbi:phosphoglycerate mutase [Thalassotalea euphylliae]|uniref:Phosphoglycerate mutase n=1 Tax=Thalassotalea euphylliae TaxID=1655234 RepID=A0A3E0U0L4_9GAMM|nr:phosphoglycerate mutase [Thalassotalea euphylliae]